MNGKRESSEPRNHEISSRVTKSEKGIIKSKADLMGMSISDYLRFLGLNAKVEVKA